MPCVDLPERLKIHVKRVTANLPGPLLAEAMAVTGKGITETLTEGLRLVCQLQAFQKAMRLKGKLRLDVDLAESRERGVELARPRKPRA